MELNYDEEMEQLKEEALAEIEEGESGIEEENDNGVSGNGDENESVVREEEDEASSEKELDKETEDDESEEESTEEEPAFEAIKVNVNGHEVEITSKEDMMAYVEAGAKSFNKGQEKHLEETTIIEQGNLSPDMLKLVVEAQNGSKEALAKIAEAGKIDLEEVFPEDAKNYEQKQTYKQATEVDRVADEIASNPEALEKFQSVAKSLPEDFISKVTSNAEILGNFNQHVQNGLAERIIPLAITAQIKNGGSFFDNYATIGQKLATEKAPETRVVSEKEQKLRRRAKTTTTSRETENRIDNGDDIWAMSDADFSKIDLRSL